LQTTDRVLELYDEGPDAGVFTDGGSVPNPGPGGWGAVYVVDGEIVGEDFGHHADTTNNRMELTALIHGVELVPLGRATTVYTDSKLAVNTITEWAAGWERRGWKRKSGPVENLDLVKQAFYVFRRRPELDLQWIQAHVGYRWNEYADALASRWRLRDE
jgi:ribonuclease HI